MKMIVLVIKFKELFPPNKDAFSGWANIQKPLLVVTWVLEFGRI